MVSVKVSILLFTAFLVGFCSCSDFVAGLKRFTCYHRKSQIKRFYCLNDFFLSFREKPFQNCHKRASQMLQCQRKVDEECLKKANKKSVFYKFYLMVRNIRSPAQLKKNFCHNAGLYAPKQTAEVIRSTGCSMEYFNRKKHCMETFGKKWRNARDSPLLCREYYEFEECHKKAALSFCSMKAVYIQELYKETHLSQLVVQLNPFCRHNRKLFMKNIR